MKKLSNMGGGRFEFSPEEFENRISKREKAIENTFNMLEEILEGYSKTYVTEGLGTKENFEKDVIRLMMLKRM
jgi:hypothetical protein